MRWHSSDAAENRFPYGSISQDQPLINWVKFIAKCEVQYKMIPVVHRNGWELNDDSSQYLENRATTKAT